MKWEFDPLVQPALCVENNPFLLCKTALCSSTFHKPNLNKSHQLTRIMVTTANIFPFFKPKETFQTSQNGGWTNPILKTIFVKKWTCHLPPHDLHSGKIPKKYVQLNHHQQQKGLGSPKTTRAWRHPSPPASPMPTLTRRRRRVWGGPVADSGWGNVSSWPTWMMTPWVFLGQPGEVRIFCYTQKEKWWKHKKATKTSKQQKKDFRNIPKRVLQSNGIQCPVSI